MNYMIGVILMAINFPKFELPKLELGSIIPNIPKIPDISNMKFKNITSAIDNLQKNNLYSQIDELNYSIKLKETEIYNYKSRLKGIKKSVTIRNGIIISIIVSTISVIIPFFIIAFKEYLIDYKNIIFIYTIASFSISMILLFGYLIYSYKKLWFFSKYLT